MPEGAGTRVVKGEIRFSISLSEEQKVAKEQILNHPYSFIMGSAGTGKTLVAIQIALDLLLKKQVDKIIITRPTVSSEKNGYLPGDLEAKMTPWLVPIIENMNTVYSRDKGNTINKLIEDRRIEIVSLAHFRGRTFGNAACIVDEFQNLTTDQLAMCIGRLGKNSIMMFCGDEYQIDLKPISHSAVSKLNKLSKSNYVYNVTLTENHRHPALKEVLELFYS